MNPVTLQDLINQTADYCQNFTSSTIDSGSTIRAINRSIEFVKRRLGLPCDKKLYSFYFYEDTMFYDAPSYFDELLELYYNNSASVQLNNNTPGHRWEVMKDTELLRDSGRYQQGNKVAYTSINGKNQIMLVGKNTWGSSIVNSFDSTNGLTYSSDVASAGTDNTIYKQGSGSLKFNINAGLNATTISFPVNLNIQSLLNNATAYRLFVDFPTGTSGYFSSVGVQLQSSVGNSYSVTTTNQFDGTAWAENAWSLLSFPLSNVTTTGSPVSTNITQITITFTHSGTFAPVTNLRVDDLYQITPDYMNCLYYSGIKGTDSTGATSKNILDQPTDIVAFGAYAVDLIDTVSLLSTVRLFPQIRGDVGFWQMYNAEVKDTLALLGRTYPHDRATGRFGQSQLNR